MRRSRFVLTAVLASPLTFAMASAPSARAATNTPPDVESSTYDTDEDKPLTVQLKARDGDGDTLQFRVSKPPKNGEASIDAKGKLTYTPKKDWHGKDEVVFEVSDGKSKSTGKATIEVGSSNDAPTWAPLPELRGQEDKQVKGQIVGNDVDKDPMTYGVAKDPTKGTLDVDVRTGKFTFTPAANAHGTITAELRISDGTTDVRVPVTFIIEPTNDPPSADESDELSTKEDEPLKGTLAASDPDEDALSFALGDKPAHGTVTIDGAKGTFVYTPAKEYAGHDAFGYVVSDGKVSAKGKVNINVMNVNDPPTIYPVALETNEDQPVKGKVLAKDFDGDSIYYSVKSEPKNGDVDVDHTSGEIVFTPKENFFGTETFTVEASDIAGGVNETVTVVVKPVNDPPTALANDSAKCDEDGAATGKLKASDIDKDPLTYALAKPPKNGTVEIKSDGTFKFVPAANFNGADTFAFEVSDGKLKSQGTMEINIKPQNDAPTTSDVKVATNEDNPARGAVKGADIDKDKLTYTLGKKSKRGKVTIDEETGAFVYEPSLHENGDDAFSIKVSDGTVEAEANVAVAIAAVNDVPVATKHDAKGNEDEPIKGNAAASDVDKDKLTWSIVGKPKNGVVEIDASTGAYSYKPNAHYNGTDAFRFEVTDGKLKAAADVALTIAAVNDAPDVKPLGLAVTEDKPTSGVLVASDIDKDKLTWSEAKAPSKGKVTLDAATGKLTYAPNLNENGEDSFVLSVSDGNAKTDANVVVKIEPVNDVPVAEKHQNSGNEDAPIKGKLVASDVDKDALTFSVIGKPRLGDVVIEPSTGAYTYTPRAHENGGDSFRYEVTDGKLKAAADVTLSVAAVNDVPEPKELVLSTTEDRDASGKIVASDIDKDALTFRLKKAPTRGIAFVDDATGAVRYVPSRDVHGADSFVVETSDGWSTADATVKVEVAPVPDAPIIDPRAIETNEDEPVSVKLTAIDPDAGDEVTFKVVGQPRIATADIESDGKTLKLTPRADQHGEDAVVVEASDGKNKVRATLPVLIASKNDPPTLDPVTATTNEETPVYVALVAHDKDGDPVKLALDGSSSSSAPAASAASVGTTSTAGKITNAKAEAKPAAAAAAPADASAAKSVTLSGNVLVVVPPRDFAGPIEVNVTPSDHGGKGPPLKVIVTVNNVNDAPTAKDTTLKATPERGVSGTIEAHDVDAGDELAFSIAVPPRHGAVTIEDAKAGRFTYVAKAGTSGDDSFRIRVKDKAGASVSATVRVTIAGGSAPAAPKDAPKDAAKDAPKPGA
jgi:large repetitive protein